MSTHKNRKWISIVRYGMHFNTFYSYHSEKIQITSRLSSIILSSTKYLGGHSDLIAGSLTFSSVELWQTMMRYRTTLGSSLVDNPFTNLSTRQTQIT